MSNIIILFINLNLMCLKHTIYYKPDIYTKAIAYANINMLLSEYASINPYT